VLCAAANRGQYPSPFAPSSRTNPVADTVSHRYKHKASLRGVRASRPQTSRRRMPQPIPSPALGDAFAQYDPTPICLRSPTTDRTRKSPHRAAVRSRQPYKEATAISPAKVSSTLSIVLKRQGPGPTAGFVSVSSFILARNADASFIGRVVAFCKPPSALVWPAPKEIVKMQSLN
jgi:hypothetical protein